MMSILNEPKPFRSSIYKIIKEIPQDFYAEYARDFFSQFSECLKIFPLLSVNIVPYRHRVNEITFSGILIPKEVIEDYGLKSDEECLKYGLKIYAIVPAKFLKNGIYVFDYHEVINFQAIPHEYRHTRKIRNHWIICTHLETNIVKESAIISVLLSAWYLFLEYKKFQRTGKYNLDSVPHNLSK